MNKIIKILFACLLVLASFFYTDKVVSFMEDKDPIMIKLKKEKDKLEESPINAKVDVSYLIPGYSGVVVDLNKSFTKMKKYGSYNEALVVFKESVPTISIDEYYDKYIVSGNGFTNYISLVFEINNKELLPKIKEVLKDNDVRATFFVDGVLLKEDSILITSLLEDFHEIELLNNKNNYDKLIFEEELDALQVIANRRGKYCLAKYDQKEILELCSKEKMHTIIPTMQISSKPYLSVKGKIREGAIISISVTKENISELDVLIKYIKQRGYTLDTLEQLLSEARNINEK
ncbi:hypothetical protein EGP98_05620 [bacterium]|nr:hypothetical protein [bacterium]